MTVKELISLLEQCDEDKELTAITYDKFGGKISDDIYKVSEEEYDVEILCAYWHNDKKEGYVKI